MREFSFQEEIRQLVRTIDNLLSTEARPKKGGLVISAQVVNFESERVGFNTYNYCWKEKHYYEKVGDFFAKDDPLLPTKKMRSPLYGINVSEHLPHDDGIWYHRREKPVSLKSKGQYKRDYSDRPNIKTEFESHNTYKESKRYWDEWCKNIYEIYPDDANSVFLKKISIELNDKQSINSGVFLSFNTFVSHHHLAKISARCEELLSKIAFEVLIPNLYESITEQSTKSAIAQVMARNMSHNIGSHVLSRMVSKTDIGDFIKDDKGIPGNSAYRQYESIGITAYKELSNVELMSNFNSYLKSRMDYLADMTTSVPTLETTKGLFKEVLGELDKNRLLLDRISGIADFNFKFILRDLTDGGEEHDSPGACSKSACACIVSEKTADILVSLPNDILGAHAFFVILENFIRNSAKHGSKPDNDLLLIYIDVKNAKVQGLYEVNIYDSSIIDNVVCQLTKEERNEFKRAGAHYKELGKLDKLVLKQNVQLNESILKNGSLRMGGWGLIEMEASAAYLRKIPVEHIDRSDYDLDLRIKDLDKCGNERKGRDLINIFKAIKVDDKHLGYRMFMMKPKEVLIVEGKDTLGVSREDRDKLLKHGILICSADFPNEPFRYNDTRVYPHALVIVDDEHRIDVNRQGFSRRIACVPTDELKKMVAEGSMDPEKLILSLWREYHKTISSGYLNNTGISLPHVRSSVYSGGRSPVHRAYYSDHGSDFIGKKEDPKFKFVEIDTSQTKIFKPSYNSLSPDLLKLLESQIVDITIIDERVQQYAMTGRYIPAQGVAIEVSHIYEQTGIFVPDSDERNEYGCNLNKQNFDAEYERILGFMRHRNGSYFTVLHLGIVEKLIDAFNNNNNEAMVYEKNHSGVRAFIMDRIIKAGVVKHWDDLIIISGRGRPHNLPHDIRYLNYSIISQYLIEVRYKFLLTEALFSARKLK